MQKGHIFSFAFGCYSIHFDIARYKHREVRRAIFAYQAYSVMHDESNLLAVPEAFGAEM